MRNIFRHDSIVKTFIPSVRPSVRVLASHREDGNPHSFVPLYVVDVYVQLVWNDGIRLSVV